MNVGVGGEECQAGYGTVSVQVERAQAMWGKRVSDGGEMKA